MSELDENVVSAMDVRGKYYVGVNMRAVLETFVAQMLNDVDVKSAEFKDLV